MAKPQKKSRSQDRKRAAQKTGPTQSVASTPEGAKPGKPSMRTQVVFRESVEAVAIAFILAFLVRTFEAEAFVIPTGSMATTLMGRHKDLVCPECGYSYRVSASDHAQARVGEGTQETYRSRPPCICPMCGYLKEDAYEKNKDKDFNGDRILVNKFAYCFKDPERWDVAVFKYPEGAKTNFIKRIVGLPNETLKISRGNLWTKPDGEDKFTIARKPPKKLRAMLKTVYDNDHVLPEKLLAKGWPARWRPEPDSAGWVTADDHRSFSNEGAAQGEQWLRYHHLAPNPDVWDAIRHGQPFPECYAAERLITDACAYNSQPTIGLNWVGDLAVSCTVDARGDQGQVILELVEGGRQMQCRIDVASGEAELSIVGTEFHWLAKTPLKGPGSYEVFFSNVDDQLRLWIDDRLVEFKQPTTYENLDNKIPTEADLRPVGVATIGADVTVSHLKVLRDIYYVAADVKYPFMHDSRIDPRSVDQFFAEPNRWKTEYSDGYMRSVPFRLGDDQFLVLGDNSPQSKDSRLWEGPEYFVHRDLLIGKAMFIYWPHSWDKVSIGNTKVWFPFFPNFKRMQFVR